MNKYKVLSREMIKYIAMFTMVLNHIAHIWEISGPLGSFMLGIGYFTGPCMCYMLVEGFYHTRSVQAYLKRLLLMGLLSQLPFNMMSNEDWFRFDQLNMMFTLALCLLLCVVYESDKIAESYRKLLIMLIVVACCFCDWNYIAPILVYLILAMRNGHMSKIRGLLYQWITFGGTMILMAWDQAAGNYLTTVTTTLLYLTGPALLTLCLKIRNQDSPVKKTLWNKWFFYLFYPGHILVLVLVKQYGVF